MVGSLQKYKGKVGKHFMRERFWYMEAYPALAKVHKEIEGMSPKCYHAYSTFQSDYRYNSLTYIMNGLIPNKNLISEKDGLTSKVSSLL